VRAFAFSARPGAGARPDHPISKHLD
jgi:hypothetical protein